MESDKNVIDVRARALILSEMKPADIPPNTPPMSKTVERIPAVLWDKCTPATAVSKHKRKNMSQRDASSVI